MTNTPRGKRNWRREVGSLLVWPISMLQSKHRDRGLAPLSMQRVILAYFVIKFGENWPTEWNLFAWASLATLTFALIVETLFAGVPFREGLQALTAIFGSVVANRVRKEEEP